MRVLFLILVVSFFFFYPSLFTYFTNDDFFFLKISNITNLSDFIDFFSLVSAPEGFGMYRPLTTQSFYLLGSKLFNFNPLGLHVISFLTFFVIIYLVFELSLRVTKNRNISLTSAFLYALSSTHFGHLYYLATFQELGMALFVLLSIFSFVKYIEKLNIRSLVFSLLFFLLGLMSKETAVVTPILLALVYWYLKRNEGIKLSTKKFLTILSPFAVCLFAYLIVRVFYYGFAVGDTYIWDFSPKKFINTIFWYLVWSLNLPETLIDFVGPGLRINPTLFIYWSRQIVPIFGLFFIECLLLIWVLMGTIIRRDKTVFKESNLISTFAVLWFVVSLLPVIFLPQHKFSFYLTLPLIAVVIRISYLLDKSKTPKIIYWSFLLTWSMISFLTINHTKNTHWVTQGALISKRAHEFFVKNQEDFKGKNVVFADTVNDSNLPWSPTQIVKVALSKENFFKVFFPNYDGKIIYGAPDDVSTETSYIIISRTLLGY